jgi:ribonuclease HI
VLEDASGAVVADGGKFLGVATNNEAEYEALRWGLETALARGVRAIEVRADSELVVRQVLGVYRVRNARLAPLHAQVMRLLASSPIQWCTYAGRRTRLPTTSRTQRWTVAGPSGPPAPRTAHARSDCSRRTECTS